MQEYSELAALKNLADKAVSAFNGCVPAAHMGTDCQNLFRLQVHEVLNDNDGLIRVLSTWEFLVNLVDFLLVPLPGLLIFGVAVSLLVEVYLANVVEQSGNSDGFRRVGVLQASLLDIPL